MSRPPSSKAHDQVLDAALRLFAEGGIDATSMDAIAEKSGVSKATIYKHWPDKDALCLEVMDNLLGKDQPRPNFETGDVRAGLVDVLAYNPPDQYSALRMRIMPHLMAYAARNRPFGDAWRASVFEPPRTRLRQLLDRGVAQGELPASLDRDLAIALLLGPMMYVHMLKRMHGEAPDNLPEQVVDAFWKAHAKRRTPAPARRPAESSNMPTRPDPTRPEPTRGEPSHEPIPRGGRGAGPAVPGFCVAVRAQGVRSGPPAKPNAPPAPAPMLRRGRRRST